MQRRRLGSAFRPSTRFSARPGATAADGDGRDVDRAVAAARQALAGSWGALSGFGRARLMHRLADILARDADPLAEVETRDTGKVLREMRGQLTVIPDWFYYFAGLADKLEGTTIPSDKANFLVYTRREPAGVVAAIVPWNSPLLLLCWKLAPALAADAVREYTQTKSVWVELSGGTRDPFTLG
jgi:(Z)-2-((N-methylformamido)methylene)-5-hydroxybutyrolactone dehydrogenase